jgi:predicted nucleic acid-binding protein
MLLDTSGLLCLFYRDEAQHPQAVQLFEAAGFCQQAAAAGRSR